MNIKLKVAGELMTKELLTIDAAETLRAASVLMTRCHVHCLVVPDADSRRCVGVITTKDVVQILCDGEETLLDQLRVSDAMSSPAFCVQKDFVIADCLRLMRMSGVRSVPVLDGTKPVGILSFTDVLRAIAGEPDSAKT